MTSPSLTIERESFFSFCQHSWFFQTRYSCGENSRRKEYMFWINTDIYLRLSTIRYADMLEHSMQHHLPPLGKRGLKFLRRISGSWLVSIYSIFHICIPYKNTFDSEVHGINMVVNHKNYSSQSPKLITIFSWIYCTMFKLLSYSFNPTSLSSIRKQIEIDQLLQNWHEPLSHTCFAQP